jgi:hypothetical protein
MDELRKITPMESILSRESKDYQDKLYMLIGRHNVLCSIERAFNNNPEALRCLNEATDEVLDSGNQSVSSIFVRAIELMSERIEDYKEDVNPDVDALRTRIRTLEAENRTANMKLDMINQLVEKQKRMG